MNEFRALFRAGRFAEAAAVVEKELQTARKSGDLEEILNKSRQLGICYFESGRISEADALLQDGLKLARGRSDAHVQVFLHELATVRWKQHRLDEGILLCKEALELDFAAGGDGSLEMHTLSVLYQEAGQLDEAMQILEIVRESCEARRDLEGLGRCLHEMAVTSVAKENWPSAIRFMVESLELKHRIGYAHGIRITAQLLNQILTEHPDLKNHAGIRADLERLGRTFK